jgi:hypothetical protein
VSKKGENNFLYADDTSIIVSNPDYNGYKLTLNKIFHEVNTWFRDNLLKLNIKNHYLQFITRNHDVCDMHNRFSHKLLVNSKRTKFLGLYIDNKPSWKNHINHHVTELVRHVL